MAKKIENKQREVVISHREGAEWLGKKENESRDKLDDFGLLEDDDD